MPEGPEVVVTVQYLKTKIKKKQIVSIEVLSGRYTHQKLNGLDLVGKQLPMTVESVDSKGKFIWFRFKGKDGKILYLLNTLGLTGSWSFKNNNSARIKMTVQSNTVSGKQYSLYFIDQRNFGTVEFTDKEAVLQKKLDKLAPDILKADLSVTDVVRLLEQFRDNRRGGKNLVKILMDQSSIVSGIGNYLVAEILYDAKLNPHLDLNDLTTDQIKRLATSMRKISKHAYYYNTSGYMINLEEFMKTHKDRVDSGFFPNYHPDISIKKAFEFKVYQNTTDKKGNKVIGDEIVKGRTIYWSPDVQKI